MSFSVRKTIKTKDDDRLHSKSDSSILGSNGKVMLYGKEGATRYNVAVAGDSTVEDSTVFSGGDGCVFLQAAGTNPAATALPVSGVVLYTDGTDLFFVDSAGTAKTVTAA